MLLTTTNKIPDAEVTEILGIVHGASFRPAKGGFKGLASPPFITKEIKFEAIESLEDEAKELIADAVIDVRLEFKSDANTVQCFISGTAVKLDNLPAWHLRQNKGAKSGRPSLLVGAEESHADVTIEEMSEEKEKAVGSFKEKFGLDNRRAENLYDSGFTSVQELKEAESLDLLAVPGINPTIVRTIKSKLG